MTYALKWRFDVVWIGNGCAPMEYPAQQVLSVTQATAFTGQTPSGLVTVPSTSAVPTTANMTTALNSAAAAAAVILETAPALAQWQGFATGGG
jgi:hypothetical protein